MDVQMWLESPKTIQKSKKSYAHFDYRIDIRKAAKFIQNSSNIVSHGFYPFIHYTMEMNKYNKKTGKKVKKREICYAAHMDRCIYQYYSFILNTYYNQKIREYGIEKIPVAYRTDLKDSNIQSAKKAFDFIRKNPKSYVMIGDFTNFFDNLDHQYLKERWCDLLNVKKLPGDHYAVFKNITRYSKWELYDLLKLNGFSRSKRDIKTLNKKATVLSKEQYKLNKHCIVKNKLSYGIPQGSPISAALANIYMIEADRKIDNIVKQHDGFYMRYSDDFIIVLPEQDGYRIFEKIINILKTIPNLQLENRKTQFFEMKLPVIMNISKSFADDADSSQKQINFLGFSFDGNKVHLRAKTIGKYYYRMNRKAKAISANKALVGADNLYMKYSERGASGKKGNFFTYVGHAENEFGADEMIRFELKNHMSKIRKILKKDNCKKSEKYYRE